MSTKEKMSLIAELLKEPIVIECPSLRVAEMAEATALNAAASGKVSLGDARLRAIHGYVLEEAFDSRIGGKLNDTEFNTHEPMSYNYDFGDEDGYTYEIKSTTNTKRNWWTFGSEQYKSFFNNTQYVNFIVYGTVFINDKGHFVCEFKLISDAKTFMNYSYTSKFDEGMLYYNHGIAKQNGHCVQINKMGK